MEVDISTLGDLARLRKRTRVPSLVLSDQLGDVTRISLDKVNFKIGKSDDCDLETPGWFAPRLAARIQRRHDGCYIQPGLRGRVTVNGRRVRRPLRLGDADELVVRGVSLTFFFRPIGPA